MYPAVLLMYFIFAFCYSAGVPCFNSPSFDAITVSPGTQEMPSLNKPVQRLKVATLPLDLPCSGPVTHSGEILTTGKSHGKKPDRFSLNGNMDVEKVSRFKYSTWNIRGLLILTCKITDNILTIDNF